MNEDIPQSPLPQPAHRPGRIILLVSVIAVLFIVFFMFRSAKPGVSREPDPAPNLITGGLSLKLSFTYTKLGMERESKAFLGRALEAYQQAARGSVMPGVIRRLGLLQGMNQPALAAKTLSGISSPKVLKDLPKVDRPTYIREANMWKRVYAGAPLTEAEAKEYAEFVETLNAGPARYIALSAIYRSAGMVKEADAALKSAQSRYFAHIAIISVLGLLFILAGIGGAAGLIAGGIALFVTRNAVVTRFGFSESYEEDAPLALALWRSFFAYIIIFLAGSFLGAYVLQRITSGLPIKQQISYGIVAQALTYVTIGLLSILLTQILLRREGAGLRAIGLRSFGPGKDIAWGAAGYAMALPLLGVSLMISNLLRLLLPNAPTPSNPVVPMLMSAAGVPALIAIFLLAAVVAPFIEEVFFRGVLFRALRARFGVWAAILTSAAAFAIVHPQLPAGFPPLFVLGMTFAILAQTRNSLLPAMIAHAINNGGLFLFFILATRP